ncbi:MAG: hypothetical protein IPH51_10125 [Rubrivivax sp.]|nr:hypothetical protein [Rubrivivax sp.]
MEHAPEIVQVVYQAALSGDLRAAQLVLERCLPAIKAVDLPIAALTLPGSTLADRAGAILDAVLGGTLTPDTGGQLLQALAQLVQIRDADQLETRLAARKPAPGPTMRPTDVEARIARLRPCIGHGRVECWCSAKARTSRVL